MKNITLAVDDKTYRAARRAAADQDTSVSALVRQYLDSLAHGKPVPAEGSAAEERSRKRLVQLLKECKLDLTERPTREATYAHRRFR